METSVNASQKWRTLIGSNKSAELNYCKQEIQIANERQSKKPRTCKAALKQLVGSTHEIIFS